MDALHPCTARAGRHNFPNALQGVKNIFVGGGGHSGDDGGDALPGFKRRHLTDPLRSGAAETVAQCTVEVGIDKPGNQSHARRVNLLQSGPVRLTDPGDDAVPNGDRHVGKGEVVLQDPDIFKKPVSLHPLTP